MGFRPTENGDEGRVIVEVGDKFKRLTAFTFLPSMVSSFKDILF